MKKSVFRGARGDGTHMAAPSSNSSTRVRPGRASTPGIPRWVKVFVIIFIVLVLLFVILEFTGHGFGGHMQMSTPMHLSIIEHGGQPL